MAKITLKGNEINTSGELPAVGSTAPDFKMVKADLTVANLGSFGKKKVLNIFPSIDTGTCAMSVRQFNKMAAELNDVTVLCVSKDLPFAQKRFCGAEGLDKVETVSVFNSDFAKSYGLEILDGPLAGLCSRSVVILDENNKVIYTQQVTETADEPDYDAVLKALS
ncbi:MAG: thiol peroxidase [Deltaproteobacteria bacterium]|nr:MAG: thiol peroxidase [Deltaproteobacteria bacterium]